MVLGRPGNVWVNSIKMDLGEIGWGVHWTGLAKDRDKWRALANVVMNLRVPENAASFSSGCKTGGLSSDAQLRTVSYQN
jgi:hypothetical protein